MVYDQLSPVQPTLVVLLQGKVVDLMEALRVSIESIKTERTTRKKVAKKPVEKKPVEEKDTAPRRSRAKTAK